MKKGNNEGSIRRRKDGRWEGRYSIGKNANGIFKKKYVYGSTQKDVLMKLKEINKNMIVGDYIENPNVRLGEWVKKWIEVIKKTTIANSTYECFNMYARKHIYIHDIACMKLVELKKIHFQTYYSEKTKILAPASISKLHQILKSSLNEAVENEYIKKNPLMNIKVPNVLKPEIKILNIQEQNVFIKALEDEVLKPLFLLALNTGMRVGEVIALTWDCVDFQKKNIIVKASAKRVFTEFDKDFVGKKSKIIIKQPKTINSTRKVPLNNFILNVLKSHKNKIKILNNLNDKVSNFVFKTQNNTIFEAKNINRTLKSICEKNKLPIITFHCLRHTFVSTMLEAGNDIKTISEIIGHSKASFTIDRYAHLMPNKKHEAVEKISKLL